MTNVLRPVGQGPSGRGHWGARCCAVRSRVLREVQITNFAWLGLEFCVVWSRVFRESWVTSFAWVLKGKGARSAPFLHCVPKEKDHVSGGSSSGVNIQQSAQWPVASRLSFTTPPV